jgi:hypothetical protein
MRNLSFRRSRYAVASLLVVGALVTGVACVEKKKETPPQAQTGLSISPVTANFGDQAIQGETAATTFTVINNGPNTSGTIGVTVEGTNADNFSAVPDNCSEKPLTSGTAAPWTSSSRRSPRPVRRTRSWWS